MTTPSRGMGLLAPVGRAGRALTRVIPAAVSGAVLLREAARASRRWQTYASRTLFSGVLLGTLLLGMWGAVGATRNGMGDAANLAWLGRALFIGFSVVQVGLATVIAPLSTAAAVIEETEEGTMEMLVLTSLRPFQILTGKILSRILVLLTVVLGALPVLALVVNLGGVGTFEVVAVCVHTVTTVVVTASLGAFFALFTRSAALAMLASVSYALPFFGLLPLAYVIATKDPSDAPQFSMFAAGAATDLSSLAAPLGYLPALAVILGLAAPLFQLAVSNADTRHAFSDDLWHTSVWLRVAVGFTTLAIPTGPLAAVVAWALSARASPGPLEQLIGVGALAWLWLLFTALTALGTWAYLRVGADVVDGLDSLLTSGVTGPRAERISGTVGRNPVLWREARPRAWLSTATPILVTWGLVMLAVMQMGWWILPGGMLLVGAGNVSAALAFGVWLGSRTIGLERRHGTLELLLATTIRPRDVVWGKFVGAMLPTAPLMVVALLLLGLGVAQLQLTPIGLGGNPLGVSGGYGVLAWFWAVPVWAFAVGLGAVAAARLPRPQTAFPLASGALVTALGVPAVVARAAPSSPLVDVPCRLLAAPLLGADLPWVVLSALMYALAALAVWGLLTARLRAWVGSAAAVGCLVLAVVGGEARAEPAPDPEAIAALEAANQLRMVARPLADGLSREGAATAVTVRIENAGAATTGTVWLAERRADGTRVRFERQVDLAEGARKDVQLLFEPGLGDTQRTVELQTADDRRAVAPFHLRPVEASAVSIAVVGDDPLGLPAALHEATTEPVPGRVHRPAVAHARLVQVGLVRPDDLPLTSVGWGAIDWVVWPSCDLSRTSVDQLEALRGWMADGGHALLGITDGWRQAQGSALADALPVTLDGVVDAEVGGLARALLADGAPHAGSLPTAHATVRADRPAVVRARSGGGDPLWVSAPFGLGSVHLLLADVGAAPLALRGVEAAWRKLLSVPAPGGSASDQLAAEAGGREIRRMLHLEAVEPPEGADGLDAEATFEGRIRQRLSAIPGVAPLPMSWLLGFAAVYLFAIGPVDYAALRLIGRQPLTWFTFPVWIALFSGGSLAMTSYTKGSQAMVVRVDVIDLVPDTVPTAPSARGATWLGVFSTRKTRLSVRSGYPDSIVAPLDTAGFQTEPRVRAGNGPGTLTYGAETWTLAYAKTEWTGPAPGTLTVEPRADGSWAARNRLGFDLDDLALQVPDPDHGRVAGWVPLGPVRDGEAVTLPSVLTPVQADRAGNADLQWAIGAFSASLPANRGSLRAEREQVMVGVAARAVEPLEITGLEPVERALTVVRAPVHEAVPAEVVLAPAGIVLVLGGLAADVTEVRAACAGVDVRPAVAEEIVLRDAPEGCTVRIDGKTWSHTFHAPPNSRWRCRAADRVVCEPAP